MRKTYGNTWWGEQWLNALKGIDLQNRLARGRTYANQQRVLDIKVRDNKIKAKVRGNSPAYYLVNIEVPPLPEQEKNLLIQEITQKPIYISQLLNRQLPKELITFCNLNKIRLLPKSWYDFDFDCNCPDFAVPCKHEAAVLYLVANEIDKDPFLIFQFKGIDLAEELARKNLLTESQEQNKITSITSLWADFIDYSDEEINAQNLFDQIDFSTIPYSQDRLFTLLSPRPPFYINGDYKKKLYKAYQVFSKNAVAYAKQESQEIPPFFNRIDEINVFVSDEFVFQKIVGYSEGSQIFQTEDFNNLFEWLEGVPIGQLKACMPPIIALYSAYQLAIHLLQKAAYVPQVLASPRGNYGIRWQPAKFIEEVEALMKLLERMIPEGFIAFNTVEDSKKRIKTCKTSEQAEVLVNLFLKYLIKKETDDNAQYSEENVDYMFFSDFIGFDDFEEREIPKIVHLWLNKFFLSQSDYVPLMKVSETDGYFKVELLIENREDDTASIITIKELLHNKAYEKIRLRVLQDISQLTEHFPQLTELTNVGKDALLFGSAEFTKILMETLPAIRLFGIRILLPKSLKKLAFPKISMEISSDEAPRVAASGLNLDTLLNFNWKIAIGDEVVDPAKFEQMMQGLSGIVKIKDQYVFIDEKEMNVILERLNNPPKISGKDLFQVALTEEYDGAKVCLDQNAQKNLQLLLKAEHIPVPEGLQATLRPYQQRGYEWLYKNATLGLGSLIADDMGLGKTIQVIAAMLRFKQENTFEKNKALAIVPTTLLTNWQKEIQKFAPDLNALIYHGPNRKLDLNHDLILTTYGIARSETTALSKLRWSFIILDEAQNIKNPQTNQTKAIKKLKGDVKIAMTGTPVENSLSEYWSIFDFLNKGYLNSLKKFKDQFARPIELDRDKNALLNFKKITAPFILRRLKSDKTIIKDLPDKIETDQFCTLTTKQAALYQNVVDAIMAQVEKADGINRRGLILKLLTALKQICNHPAQYLKSKAIEPEDSGKTSLLLDLMEQIFNAEEKVLIFTQYREMGELLVALFNEKFDLEVPFLHGGVPRKQRDVMVTNFQERPYVKAMLISLKAGGTGLNLTAASNVIHYDLWWNPAVEAQATDRAYRIGQQQNVQVHRFITLNTFEEKINQLLQSKKDLADLATATGEKWVGDLSNQELRALITLTE